MDSNGKEGKKMKLEIYAERAHSISDRDKEFTGIPLQCRMLAEAFGEEVKTFYQSAESVPEFLHKLDLLRLYEKFLKKKYDICCEEKFKMSSTNVGAKTARKQFAKNIRAYHQTLALETLLYRR
jgi:hypothetical protein